MGLDHTDAFNETPLDEREIPFCCTDLGPDGLLALYGMGFGGRSFRNVYGRKTSLLCRLTQAMLSPLPTQLQHFVDDPIMTSMG